MAVKFPLKMADGAAVRTLEDLREHFDLTTVLSYYDNRRLVKWLENGYYDEEAEKVAALDVASPDFAKELCAVLGVEHLEDAHGAVDLSNISNRNERLNRLKQYTADDTILAAVDSVAFTQEELVSLLEAGAKKVYLVGGEFQAPVEGFEDAVYMSITDAGLVNLGEVAKRNKRIEQLRQFTDDDAVLAAVDRVAFTQKELMSLLENGAKEVYLIGYEIPIPLEEFEDVSYIGITETGLVDLGEFARRNERIKRNKRIEQLRQFTDDDAVLAAVDRVAFTQEELVSLLEKGAREVYLVGYEIPIPLEEFEDVSYIGITETGLVDRGEFARRKRRRELFLEHNDDEYFMAEVVDRVAFSQKELDALLKKGVKEIYLCGDDFHIPVEGFGDVVYVGVTEEDSEFIKDSFIKAAESGDAQAQVRLADIYLKYTDYMGWNHDDLLCEAEKWYREAEKQGCAEAYMGLGKLYLIAELDGGWVPSQHTIHATACGDDDEKLAELADIIIKEGIEYLEMAVSGGCVAALVALGDIYCGLKDSWVEFSWDRLKHCSQIRINAENGVIYYERAVKQGCVEAMMRLFYVYSGVADHIEADYEESLKWCRRAAEQGCLDAQLALADCFEDYRFKEEIRDYMEEDEEETVKWWRMAAEQGCVKAQEELGDYYETSRRNRDLKEAKRWYQIAAANGSKGAEVSLYGIANEDDDN